MYSFPKTTFINNNTLWVDPATHTVKTGNFFKRKVWIFSIYNVETGTFWNSKWQRKIRLKISFKKCMCWRRGHKVFEIKWSKNDVFSFISYFKRLWRHKESLIWPEYGRLYKIEQKNTRYYSRDYSSKKLKENNNYPDLHFCNKNFTST